MKKLAAAAAGLLSILILALVALFTVGGVSLVSTRGISMEPQFRTGDLAVLRPAAHYAVGDIASYRSAELSTVVMHRIVAVDDGRYTFQGDNNTWLDSEQPTRAQLVGKLALQIPQGGVWLDRATSRAAAGAVAFLLLASGGTTAALTRRQRRRKRNAMTPASLPPAFRQLSPALRTASAVVTALALASGGLALMAFNRPLTVLAAQQQPAKSTSTVAFSYHATVPYSAAYDSTTVTQPQPVFRKLADTVVVDFRYDSDTPVSDATVEVTAQLATANGWKSSVPLTAPRSFTGDSYTGSVELVLADVQRRASAAANAIGEDAAGDVSVSVIPKITTGDDSAFRPELRFTLNGTALRLADAEPELTVSATGSAVATATGQRPATVIVLGRSVLIQHLRVGAVVVAIFTLLAAVVVALLVRRSRQIPEVDAIQLRYSETLLPVEPMVLPAGRPVVEVPQIDALVRLAQRYGLFVMHWDRGGRHTYIVLDDATTYRFRSGTGFATTHADEELPTPATARPKQ